jgi:hypothetical protein
VIKWPERNRVATDGRDATPGRVLEQDVVSAEAVERCLDLAFQDVAA